MVRNTYTKGDIKTKIHYDISGYSYSIPNYDTITTLPKENAEYIKEALPNVNNCEYMLYGCKALTSVDTTGWDTSNITYMYNMFGDCKALTSIDVSNWDTSNVTNMISMFWNCQSLTTLDGVFNWDTNKVTDMNGMFSGCSSLTTLDLSKWNTSNVTDMSLMFHDCKSLTTLDVSNWDTSKVSNMSNMFGLYWGNGVELTTIKGIIDMKSCDSYSSMFGFCTKLRGVKIKNPPADFETRSGLTKDQYEIVS